MTLAVFTWIETKFGILKTEVVAIEPEVLAWAKAFLTDITPVIKQAATDAVLAAISVPGGGAVKFAAATAAATADLLSKGVPVVENDIKAAIQIAYKSLPVAITGNAAAIAVVNAANAEVDAVAVKVEGTEAPVAATVTTVTEVSAIPAPALAGGGN